MAYEGAGNAVGEILTWDGTSAIWAPPATLGPFATIDQATVDPLGRLVDVDTTDLPDGSTAWVNSVENFFVFDSTSVVAADGVTVAAPAVGPGRWFRLIAGNGIWQNRTAWFISTAVGNDEFDGTAAVPVVGTLVGPLASMDELCRRLCGGGLVCPVNATTTVTLVAGTASAVNLDLFVATGIFFVIVGSFTSTAPSAIDAVTATDPTTDTRGSITDAATAFTDHKRLRLTSGGSTGALAYTTGLPAAGEAYVSHWALVDPMVSTIPTLTEPTVGTTFSADTYSTTLIITELNCRGPGRVIVRDCIVTSGTKQRITRDSKNEGGVYFYGCHFQSADFSASEVFLVACMIQGLVVDHSVVQLRACTIFGVIPTEVATVNHGGHLALTRGCQFDGCGLVASLGGDLSFSGAANGDCSWVDGTNVSALTIDTGSAAVILDGGTELWGADNAFTTATFILVGGGTLAYSATSLPHVPGGAADTQIGGILTAYAALPFFNSMNGAAMVIYE